MPELKLFLVTFTKENTYVVLARDAEEAQKSCKACPDVDDWIDVDWDVAVSPLDDAVLLKNPTMEVSMAVNRSNFELVCIVDFDGDADWRSEILRRAREKRQQESVQELPGI